MALRVAFAIVLVLGLLELNKQFVVTTDASDAAVGEILEWDLGNELQPIAFTSQKLQEAEVSNSTYEHELVERVGQ